MKNVVRSIWLLVAACTGMPHAADSVPAPASRPSIAVMSLVGQGVDSMSAMIVTDALSDELLKTGKFRVMERSQMENVLKEQGFQASGACDGTECAMEVGKLLSVDNVVVGCLGKLGESYSLTVRTVDITTGEVIASSRVLQRGAIDQVVADALPRVSAELSGGKPMPAKKEQDEVSEGGKSTWGWWVAGGVVVAGGVAAAILLLKDDGTEDPEPNPNVNDDGSWQTTVRW